MAKSSVLLSTLVDLVTSGHVATSQQTVRQLQSLNEEFPCMLLHSLYRNIVQVDDDVRKLLRMPLVRSMAACGKDVQLDFDMCADSDSDQRCSLHAEGSDDDSDSDSDDDDDAGGDDGEHVSDGDDSDSDISRWDEVHDRLDDIQHSVGNLASTVSSSFLAIQIIGATSTFGMLIALLSMWRQCTDATAIGVCRV